MLAVLCSADVMRGEVFPFVCGVAVRKRHPEGGEEEEEELTLAAAVVCGHGVHVLRAIERRDAELWRRRQEMKENEKEGNQQQQPLQQQQQEQQQPPDEHAESAGEEDMPTGLRGQMEAVLEDMQQMDLLGGMTMTEQDFDAERLYHSHPKARGEEATATREAEELRVRELQVAKAVLRRLRDHPAEQGNQAFLSWNAQSDWAAACCARRGAGASLIPQFSVVHVANLGTEPLPTPATLASLRPASSDMWRALVCACILRNVPMVQCCLQQLDTLPAKQKAAQLNKLGRVEPLFGARLVPPLTLAAWSSSAEIMRLLLDAGALAAGPNQTEWRPVDCVCAERCIERSTERLDVLRALLSDRVAVENGGPGDLEASRETPPRPLWMPSRSRWRTPLAAAAESTWVEGVKCLIEHGVDPSTPARPNLDFVRDLCSAPLHCAAAAGSLPIVRLLIAAGANADQADARRVTALQYAARWGHANVARTLVQDYNVDVNAVSHGLFTPLVRACHHGHYETAKVLMALGASVNGAALAGERRPASPGLTPLMRCASSGHARCMELLLTHPDAEVDLQSLAGPTALLLAAEHSHVDCLRLLLEAGANPAVSSRLDGGTALLRACARNSVECIEVLYAHGANMLQRSLSSTRENPLEQAISAGHVEAMKACIRLGADVNAREFVPDADTQASMHPMSTAETAGRTPLMMVVACNRPPMLRAFLAAAERAGAAVDLTALDREGHSVRDHLAETALQASVRQNQALERCVQDMTTMLDAYAS